MSNSTEPMHLGRMTSDYVQMVLFGLLMAIGLPVNISTLVYMLRRYRHAKSFLLLLHINLNISDILVLGVYVPGMMGWLISHQWLAGNIMCKAMRFIDAFVWAISSNIMVCIAVYRLFALRYPLWISAVGHSRVPRMLVAAWIVAAISMSPQLLVWKQVEFPGLTQCQSIWVTRMTDPSVEETSDDLWWIKVYTMQSVFIVFYIPLVILIFCYVLILKDIYKTLQSDVELSSALYTGSEMSKSNSAKERDTKREKESFVSIRTVRGQDKFRRVKIKSLRITLVLILAYVITWLPYNLLSWWLVISFDSYRENENDMFPLSFLVILNSVINPFIYGRCQGLKLLLSCRRVDRKSKSLFRILCG